MREVRPHYSVSQIADTVSFFTITIITMIIFIIIILIIVCSLNLVSTRDDHRQR